MKVYVASSWRNTRQPEVVAALRKARHDVYDFRHPSGPESGGFSWSEIDPKWKDWTQDEYVRALSHPIAVAGFEADMNALKECDACVLVMPCGRSAHLELGWAIGSRRLGLVLLDPIVPTEPELMVAMADLITPDLSQVINFLGKPRR